MLDGEMGERRELGRHAARPPEHPTASSAIFSGHLAGRACRIHDEGDARPGSQSRVLAELDMNGFHQRHLPRQHEQSGLGWIASPVNSTGS
jgi:hypothetical protein